MPSKYKLTYCEITIVHWGPLLVAFDGNPYSFVLILTNVYTNNFLIFIKTYPNLLSTKKRPHE